MTPSTFLTVTSWTAITPCKRSRRRWTAARKILVLCDTNGGTMPWEIEQLMRDVQENLPGARLGIHTAQ